MTGIFPRIAVIICNEPHPSPPLPSGVTLSLANVAPWRQDHVGMNYTGNLNPT